MVKVLQDLTTNQVWRGDKPEWIDNLGNHVWCANDRNQINTYNTEREQSCIYKILSRFPRVLKGFEEPC